MNKKIINKMAKFFLKLGSINKKLLLPVIAFILYMIMDIIDYYSQMAELHLILELYTRGISYTAIIIIPIIQKCRDKKAGEKKKKVDVLKKFF